MSIIQGYHRGWVASDQGWDLIFLAVNVPTRKESNALKQCGNSYGENSRTKMSDNLENIPYQ
jgi:hypothetical protein